ncbi:MAG TPA: sigma-54 dependent transcriptional regulator [Gemmatimonadaceae bacterium]|nr:sigma-54 dependent transcriptional regulator [Gemmatimonadaceae bacterium]
MAQILYVDDEPAIGLILQDTLERMGHTAIGAGNVPEALAALAESDVDLVISDFRMPGLSGLEFIELLREQGRDVPVIMLTGYATIEHAVAAIKAGAVDYITKPLQADQLEHAVTTALELTRLKRENEALRREVMEMRAERTIVAKSASMREVLQIIGSAAPTRATVLLQGESGTGKELLARAIHDQSDRRDRAFIKLNCAAVPEGLVESALFGHEKGAFTGAIKRVAGAFERAHRGTLLLDEITEMRLDLQAKLLRVLQEQEFERVGGSETVSVDVRIVATTNRDIELAVERSGFRRDLYYRLSVIPVQIPPLRARPEDIPLLALTFAQRVAAEVGREVTGIAPDALALLQRYEWPGNVRELQHAVERAVILSGGNLLPASSFDLIRTAVTGRRTPLTLPALDTESPSADAVVLNTLNIDEAEAALVARALQATGGNKTKAAELLGVSDRTLRNKLSRQRSPGQNS